jgi:hypothetical protein
MPGEVVYEVHVARWPCWVPEPARTFRRLWVARLVAWFIHAVGASGLAEVKPMVHILAVGPG